MRDGFLTRWTRRKLAVRAAERAADSAADPSAGPSANATEGKGAAADASARHGPAGGANTAPVPSGSVPDPVADHPAATSDPLPELPDLDALTRESDLTPFLRAGVPATLRNAALRRMWSIDPAIRDFVSEAREYAYDWNSPGGVPGLGPLLPSDDVQAMLRKILGGRPVETAAPEAGESPSLAEAAAPDPDVVPEAEPPTEEPGRAALTVQASSLPESAPSPASAETDAILPASRPGSIPAAAPGPRLRRHGGAMPA